MKTLSSDAITAMTDGTAISVGAVKLANSKQFFDAPMTVTTIAISWYQSCLSKGGGNDQARMGIAFTNLVGAVMGSITWATMTATTAGVWTNRTLSAVNPGGAYGFRLYMEMNRVSGATLEAYIDDITYSLDGSSYVAAPFGGAEDGGVVPSLWASVTGALSVTDGSGGRPSPHGGSYYYYGGSTPAMRAFCVPTPLFGFLTPVDDIRVWGGYGYLTLDGEDYAGIGDRGLITITGAALGDSEQNATLSLSGVEPALLALFDGITLRRQPCKIWLLTFDGSATVMLDSHVYMVGRVDTVQIDETIGSTATIVLQIETAARGLGRSGQRMRTDADQRLINPSDAGFRAISFAGKKMLYWGGQRPSSAGGAGLSSGAAAPYVPSGTYY